MCTAVSVMKLSMKSLAWAALRVFTFLPETAVHFSLFELLLYFLADLARLTHIDDKNKKGLES